MRRHIALLAAFGLLWGTGAALGQTVADQAMREAEAGAAAARARASGSGSAIISGLFAKKQPRLELPPPVVLLPAQANAQSRVAVLSKLMVEAPVGRPYANIKSHLLCLPYKIEAWDVQTSEIPVSGNTGMGVRFNAILARAGFKVAGEPGNMFEDASSSAADLEIGGAITDLREDLCYPLSDLHDYQSAKGAMRIDMEWQVYSRLERKVLARIVTAGGAEVRQPGVGTQDVLLASAFEENVKALANTPEFRAVLAAAPADRPARPEGLSPLSIAVSVGPRTVADDVGSVVAVFAGDGFGSGFVLGDGYVLTNQHVVGESATVKVRWSDGLEGLGNVLRSDRRRDVALVKVDTRGRPALGIRRQPVQPGDTVFVIGTPLDLKFADTVTRGVVSANRTFNGFAFIQSDVMVNHGDSGGPLLDEKGQVVGLTVSGYQPDGAPAGINLFIPIRDAVDFLALSISAAG